MVFFVICVLNVPNLSRLPNEISVAPISSGLNLLVFLFNWDGQNDQNVLNDPNVLNGPNELNEQNVPNGQNDLNDPHEKTVDHN